jgi:hypothetical protein
MINSSFPAREAWLKEFVLMYIDINWIVSFLPHCLC